MQLNIRVDFFYRNWTVDFYHQNCYWKSFKKTMTLCPLWIGEIVTASDNSFNTGMFAFYFFKIVQKIQLYSKEISLHGY